jgi:hypothetical protein
MFEVRQFRNPQHMRSRVDFLANIEEEVRHSKRYDGIRLDEQQRQEPSIFVCLSGSHRDINF